MSRPLLLDLFCGAGGAAMGYHQAGFEVIGVDINPQPNYPFESRQGDALTVFLNIMAHHKAGTIAAVHASPPCQAYSNAQRIRGRTHPDLIGLVRAELARWGNPWVIENVPGSPLINPVELCGAMFGLGTYRHRLFESNITLTAPDHPEHTAATTKMGRPPKVGEMMHVVGNFSGVKQARQAMDIDWMTRGEMSESIPPAFTNHVGEQLLAALAVPAAVEG